MTIMDDQPLLTKLTEDLGTPAEATSALPTAHRLQAWSAPTPTAADTARLLAVLQPELPAPVARPSPLATWPVLLLRSQLHVVRGEIWAASALVFTLGTAVTLIMQTREVLPLVLLAPIVAALGIAFLYGPLADPALEIELASPASLQLIGLARLVLVFGFNLILGLAGSAVLVVLRSDLSFWPLVSLWLAPMAFLSALAFLLSILFLGPDLSVTISLLLWVLMVAVRLSQAQGLGLMDWPDLFSAPAQPWLWTGAGVASALALWLSGRTERWMGRAA
jgi:hypothetical protein